MSAIADTAPANEAQARPLTKLDPERQPEAWQRATDDAAAAGEPVRARHVEEAVAGIRGTKPEEDPALHLLERARRDISWARMMVPRGPNADRLATAASMVLVVIRDLTLIRDLKELKGPDGAPTPPTIGAEWRQVLDGGQSLHVCHSCERVLHDDEVTEVWECSNENCGEVFDAKENGERNCPVCNRPFTRLLNKAGCSNCLADDALVTVTTYEGLLAAVAAEPR